MKCPSFEEKKKKTTVYSFVERAILLKRKLQCTLRFCWSSNSERTKSDNGMARLNGPFVCSSPTLVSRLFYSFTKWPTTRSSVDAFTFI